MNIIDLLQAPKIECLVKDKITGEVLYEGDSSYEANIAYNQHLKKKGKPIYEKKMGRLFDVSDVKDVISLAELVYLVPQRVQPLYFSVLSGKPPSEGDMLLAAQFYPEYFPSLNQLIK